jgi:hypothetical protein
MTGSKRAKLGKLKTVTLSYPYPNPNKPGVWDYRVETVGNSVDLVPDQMLTTSAVDVLCAADNWNVLIMRKDEP